MKGETPIGSQAGAAELVARCAALLSEAELNRRPMEPLTKIFPALDVANAYRIQQANVERRLAGGEKIVGHKIGLTAKAMQELFGVREPDYGHLLTTMLHDAHKALDLGELIDPQIEVEPAFVLGARLQGPGVSIADVLAATRYVSVCFEVIDSRIIDWRIKLPDTVADNGSSARVVLGANRAPPSLLSLDDMDTELELDGAVVETGNTSAILSHPANGICWLANRLSEFGVALEPGQIVLPGTCTRSVRIGGHHRVAGRIAGLGEVVLDLTGAPSIPNRKRN
ncbi:MAG TPA: fumarylacetoacetate hydrolase family protein [Steroidobacteraceae bacterium]|nr:fumarylacetoacetate hydrolase family protein [Steroidobacteraceae bacterium]